MIESAPGHLGLLALVLPWQGSVEHADLMARARHFAPLLEQTRDGGEGRTRLHGLGPGPDRLPARRGRARHGAARADLDGPARPGGGVRQILAVGQPMPRHVVDDAVGEERRYAAFEARLAATDFRPHRATIASAHQMGTVRMGSDPAAHPADERGRSPICAVA